YLHLFDRWAWFYEFRSLPGTELAGSGIGLLAGFLFAASGAQPRIVRFAIPVLALLVVFVPFAKPVLRPLNATSFADRWKDGVCLQSTPSSCGPACVATLLREAGQEVSERELARECFTYSGGTENWYLARSLRSRGLGVRYEVSSRDPASIPCPSIAGVGVAGAGHFITVLRRNGDSYVVGDPLFGRLTLAAADLRTRYRFTGFFMIVRLSNSGAPSCL